MSLSYLVTLSAGESAANRRSKADCKTKLESPWPRKRYRSRSNTPLVKRICENWRMNSPKVLKLYSAIGFGLVAMQASLINFLNRKSPSQLNFGHDIYDRAPKSIFAIVFRQDEASIAC